MLTWKQSLPKCNLRMAQGTKCLHAICNYMRKVKLKYQHVHPTPTLHINVNFCMYILFLLAQVNTDAYTSWTYLTTVSYHFSLILFVVHLCIHISYIPIHGIRSIYKEPVKWSHVAFIYSSRTMTYFDYF